MTDKCEIETLTEPIDYDNAVKKVMDFTYETDKEAGFNFIKDSTIAHINQIYYGECDRLNMDYPKGDNDGQFHTHTKEIVCEPSDRDRVSNMGYYMVIGCPYTLYIPSKEQKKRIDLYSTTDLRLLDKTNLDAYQDAIEVECKEMWED